MTQDNNTTPRPLTIAVFVVVVVFLVWLAVQLVTFLPTAFSSLASIADGINSYRPTADLNLRTGNSVVNSGSSFTLSWDEPRQSGVYEFMVSCADGVNVSARHGADVTELNCGETLTFTTDVSSLDVTATSEERRFIDITYDLTYTPENGEATTESDVITIVNASIPTQTTVVEDETEQDDEPDGNVAGDSVSTDDESTTVTAGEPTPQYQTIETPIYAIPESDPNGTIDLAVSYLGVGTIENGTFQKTGEIATDEEGAIRFVVKNLGTKTSDEWTFDAELPSDIDYTSETQAPLKPNEEAFITLRFTGLGRAGVELSTVTVMSSDETSVNNNSFNWAITVVD